MIRLQPLPASAPRQGSSWGSIPYLRTSCRQRSSTSITGRREAVDPSHRHGRIETAVQRAGDCEVFGHRVHQSSIEATLATKRATPMAKAGRIGHPFSHLIRSANKGSKSAANAARPDGALCRIEAIVISESRPGELEGESARGRRSIWEARRSPSFRQSVPLCSGQRRSRGTRSASNDPVKNEYPDEGQAPAGNDRRARLQAEI